MKVLDEHNTARTIRSTKMNASFVQRLLKPHMQVHYILYMLLYSTSCTSRETQSSVHDTKKKHNIQLAGTSSSSA